MEFQIANIIYRSVDAVVGWFGDLVGNTGVFSIYISFVIVHLSVRYLFGSLMFSRGSDRAKKKKGGDE